ncbi:unnamed protein product [Peronospora belbahrii]|uniref:Haloacid dehalogenase-like hydrolase n=1 Tax=Peronospora belbahrii TaxID=622444 RepID=A0AAU9KXE3_9STRA|nr:unnamed protein product [Peronospora belbahrii]CAH0520223.1 unnamed protein product [Peronospora belbahrii]
MSVTNPASSLIVRGVTFDLDDTLWCGKTVLRKANDAFHAFLMQKTPQLAQQFPPATFDTLLVEFQQSMPEKAHDYTFLRKHTLNYCINVCGALNLELEDEIQLETFINAAFQAFLIPRSQPELFDGVEHLFQALKQEIREWNQDIDPILGVITNGNCKMENLPEYFNQHMNFIVSAEVVGTAKPNLAIFDAAVAKFPPVNDRQQIVHVGDHYECDVEGAKHAGLRTIWVNAKWTKPNALTRTELDLEDAERYVAADAIVKEVNAVLLVVKHWNMLAASST